jgi:type IV pilus assembly protein PilM
MSSPLSERVRVAFAPPRYLALPLTGVDLSTSGVKIAHLVDGADGLTLASYAQSRLPAGAFADGEIVDHAAVVEALVLAAAEAGISAANVTLSESKSYLFETLAPGADKVEWYTSIEQHLDEFIPIPPAEASFDFVSAGKNDNGDTRIAGIGFASRVIDDTLAAFDEAGISVCALEGEMFASSRALLPQGDDSTVLVIDVGKTTTKISIIAWRIPRFTTTIGIGGHALTLAVQKYFGVTEAEARKVKAERGIVPMPGNEEYLAAMLSTVSAIRDEISRHLVYWQERAAPGTAHEPVSRALLVGGNASVRGLPEYLEGVLKIPVAAGDVFTNLASRDTWIPSLDYNESLAYSTAIGLALRDCIPRHA